MAQVRQEAEEYQSGQIACYAGYGLTAVKTMIGTVGFVDLPQDPATQALVDEASADCNARFPLPEFMNNRVLDDAAYQKMLDTRECIVAHGYSVPDPPSAETWKESSLETAFNPYNEFINGSSQSAMTPVELFALADACPQAGPNFVALAPTN